MVVIIVIIIHVINYCGMWQDVPTRHKRDTQTEAEDYEEETNRVWGGSPRTRRTRGLCRRRPLYVEFSDINYDSWIVAPNGYQVFQLCNGYMTQIRLDFQE